MAVLTWVIVWLVMLIGWVMNIIQVVDTFNIDAITGLIIIKIIGIVVGPLGAVMGWIGLFQ